MMGTEYAQILYGTDDADIFGYCAGCAGAILDSITEGADVDSIFRCVAPIVSQQHFDVDWE